MNSERVNKPLKTPELGAATTVLIIIVKEWKDKEGKYMEYCEAGCGEDDNNEAFVVGHVRQTYEFSMTQTLKNVVCGTAHKNCEDERQILDWQVMVHY